jgi:hypothetical protein
MLFTRILRLFLVVQITLLGQGLYAQPVNSSPNGVQLRDPLDSKAPIAHFTFNSLFSGYQAANPAVIGSWKNANKTVGEIGGWRAYANEAAHAPASTSTQTLRGSMQGGQQ